ncbi:MAG: DUF3862 domain-containing protein [Clostridiales bacterium]|nr:DUF3862 domain-containing protein [Clostridiales bacterium]
MEEIKLNVNEEVNNAKKFKGGWAILIAFIFVIGCIIAVSSVGFESNSYLNRENYSKIRTGMSYTQVVEVLEGHEGEMDTSSSFGGYTLAYYTWSNSSGSKCIVVGFENGKVCAKSQYGL